MDALANLARKVLFYLALLLAIVLPIELFSFAYLGFTTGQWASPQFFFQHRFAQQQKQGCWWADSLMPHPYLSYAYHRGQPCSQEGINNISLKGPEFPFTNDPNFYDILVIGGSVAELFSAQHPRATNLLEKRLNDSYVSPNKKPFRILRGAISAGRQPMQLISLILFGNRADAVISLEGFNELVPYLLSRPMIEPTFEWKALMASRSSLDLPHHKIYFLSRIVISVAMNNIFLSNSYTAFLFTRLTYAIVEKELREPDRTASMNEPVPNFPAPWGQKKRRQEVLRQYRRMLRLQWAMAREENLPYFTFIQPAPALYKKLTDKERSVVGDLAYGPVYQEFTREVLRLRKDGFPIASLLKILLPVEKSIYLDNIHFKGDGTAGTGYDLLAKAMADILGVEWHLERRK